MSFWGLCAAVSALGIATVARIFLGPVRHRRPPEPRYVPPEPEACPPGQRLIYESETVPPFNGPEGTA